MPRFPYKSGTVLIPSGTTDNPNNRHLFILCTDECSLGRFLLVPVSSWTGTLCDPSCRLAVGDHPFITHPSYILYRYARIEARTALERGVASGAFKVQDPVTGHLLLRIRKGVCASPQTPRKMKSYFGCP